MNLITTLGVLAALCVATLATDPHEHDKVVCYWNSTSFYRPGPGKFQVDDLQQALSLCTHLIYGFAGVDAGSLEAIPLNPKLDTGAGHGFYRLVNQWKATFVNLKVYLSIGGNADPYEETHEYLRITETAEARTKFINSVARLLNDNDFDGIDLAWQFPETKVKKERSAIGKIWQGLKRKLGYGKFKDDKEQLHRDGFTILVRDLRTALKPKNKALTLTVLPHINSTVYYDARNLQPHLDAVHLLQFSQKSPDRTPDEADYPAPIYENYGRVRDENIDVVVNYWMERGTPASKIVIGLPAFAHTWKLSSESSRSGVPPLSADGPGPEGPQTGTPGLLAYGEVCPRLTESSGSRLTKITDPSKKYGNYAFKPYDEKTSTEGVWVGYEDPNTAGNKAAYAKAKGLGGIAIYDLSLDDFRGVCSSEKFPILRAATSKL